MNCIKSVISSDNISRVLLHRKSNHTVSTIVSYFAALNRKDRVSHRVVKVVGGRTLCKPTERLVLISAGVSEEADH